MMDQPVARQPRGPFRLWWDEHVRGTVDHVDVVHRVQEDGGWSAHFAFMTIMSAGIAVLGLLLSSPAVVIGAMLISPLMGPIIGLGFAIATFDSAELRRSAIATGVGVVLAVAFCALVVLLSPLQTVTSEIAARTRPNLFDLLVALFSGLAGTYATIRGRHGAIVGVAIATALMPPLAVVGFGLATANAEVFWGSLLLFTTNLLTIAIAAAFLARLYGFASNLSPRQTRLQASLMLVTFAALGLPLGVALNRIAWEAVASAQARDVISRQFGDYSRLSDLLIDFDADPVAIDATMLTADRRGNAEKAAEQELAGALGRPVRVSIEQLLVGNGDAGVDEAAAGRLGATERAANRLTERLALVAGVDPDAVLIDRLGRRARVRAAVLPGADLGSYRALEARIAAQERDWSIALVPPPMPPEPIPFSDETPDAAGGRALADAIWAARRLGLAIGVAGQDQARVDAVLGSLADGGVPAAPAADPPEDEASVALRWRAPTLGAER
jgi:uncharacterized hydrophobic protein (TIGR00271 family)